MFRAGGRKDGGIHSGTGVSVEGRVIHLEILGLFNIQTKVDGCFGGMANHGILAYIPTFVAAAKLHRVS